MSINQLYIFLRKKHLIFLYFIKILMRVQETNSNALNVFRNCKFYLKFLHIYKIIPRPRFLWIPVWLRTLFFIPFYLSCNFAIEKPHLPVLITNDHVYVFGCIIFSFTNGYLASLGLMYYKRFPALKVLMFISEIYNMKFSADGLFNAYIKCMIRMTESKQRVTRLFKYIGINMSKF
ncbi:unnamed protein product [Trichobilharzia regenti]|nr:unnamed protein product [Trichobilharzia regenti]